MPLPGSQREKKMLQEIAGEAEQQPQFLQEINEPVHEETLVERLVEAVKPKRRSRKKKAD